MTSSARYCLYLPDEGPDPVDATDDYDEALALCRALVAEEGYGQAEVRLGERICCAADRDAGGRLRMRDVGDAGAAARPGEAADRAPSSRPATRRARLYEDDVTDRLLARGQADARPGEPNASPAHPGDAIVTPAPIRLLGEESGGPPTRWLGL